MKKKTLFRVQYKVKEEDTPINMRASVEDLETLHRMLASMDSFQTPVAEWNFLEVHEVLENGTVAVIPQKHLANLYDWQYGFGKKSEKEEAVAEEELEPMPLTAVHIVRRKGKMPKVSNAFWWKESDHAY